MENHQAEKRHTQIKVKNPKDLFSIIPYALGYQPDESILVICIRQAGGLGMIARTSLSDLANNDCCIELSQLVARNAADDQTSRAFVIVYCRATDEFTLHSYKKQARYFSEAFGSTPTETWIINNQRYFRVDCQGENCCPPEGFPISDLANTEASTQLVYRGYAPARSREEYLQLPEPSSQNAADAQVAEQCFAKERRRIGFITTWRQKAFDAWLDATTMVAEGEQLGARVCGLLSAALADTTMRDAVLLSCLPGGQDAASRLIENSGNGQRRPVTDDTVSALLAGVIDNQGDNQPIPPERMKLLYAAKVLESVATHSTRNNKVAPLSLLAFLAWWAGDGTRASARARQALELNPNYPLALTLAQALECRLLPAWIKAKQNVTVGKPSSAQSGQGQAA